MGAETQAKHLAASLPQLTPISGNSGPAGIARLPGRIAHEYTVGVSRTRSLSRSGGSNGIVVIDGEGFVVDFNPAAEAIFGYARDAVIGEPIAELIIPPEQRAAHEHGLSRYLATGAGHVLGKRLELPAMLSTGELIPIELTITDVTLGGRRLFAAHIDQRAHRPQDHRRHRGRPGGGYGFAHQPVCRRRSAAASSIRSSRPNRKGRAPASAWSCPRGWWKHMAAV
ncbi:PAS domain S-box protein [Shinella sp. M27]|uniref:PAS domain S-box protein n=1 Tax=Shinella sp. M27 TaxID=3368614 RepID=UPI003BA05F13